MIVFSSIITLFYISTVIGNECVANGYGEGNPWTCNLAGPLPAFHSYVYPLGAAGTSIAFNIDSEFGELAIGPGVWFKTTGVDEGGGTFPCIGMAMMGCHNYNPVGYIPASGTVSCDAATFSLPATEPFVRTCNCMWD